MGKDQKQLRICSKYPIELISDVEILVKLDFGKNINLAKVLGQ